jgi:mannan endo-1,4-beta-mannosidase
MPKDNFSVRWSRQATFASGRYRFYAWADDGIRVRVNGELILNEWHASAGDEVYTADLPLDGTRSVVVEYYEQGGDARARFWWTRIGDR